MNWYKTAQVNKKAYDFKGQEKGLDDNFGDVQRYVFDSYNIRIFLNKTDYKLTVSLVASHFYIGTVVLNLFWDFNLDQNKEARSVYKDVIRICKETITQFVAEEIPTNLFFSYLRKKLHKINDRDMTKTNIPTINYSYDIDYEDDWRKTIYGPRYPLYREESFNQYLNSSIYSKANPPSGKFAL